VRGFSVSHPPLELKRDAYLELTRHAAEGDIVVDLDRRPLDDVAAAWERQREAAGGPKQVLVPVKGAP
jgi:NADPH2:quinone reductase